LFDFSHVSPEEAKNSVVWEERKEAEGMLERYLIDVPSEHCSDMEITMATDFSRVIGTIAFVHGPAGSGKSSVINRLLKDFHRYLLQYASHDI
jgi:putative ribosome biogenesis GTPase RsgA